MTSSSSSGDSTPRQQALATLRAYYDAFNRRDRAAMYALLTDDVAHDLNQGERQHGKETFTAFMGQMDRCYREQLSGVSVTASDDGARAAAEYVVQGEYLAQDGDLPPAAGQTYVLPGGAFFELEGGLIARVSNYYNLQDWLRQIGAASGG